MARPLQPCGTNAAYKRHLRRGEVPCEDCMAGIREYTARQRRARGIPERGPLKPCGTNAAYMRHHRRGEKPCDPCQQAHRAAKAFYTNRSNRNKKDGS